MEYKTLNQIATNFRYGKMPDKSKITDSGDYPVWSGYRYVGFYDGKNVNKDEIVVVARGVGGTGDVKICKEDCFLTNLSIAFNVNEDINPLYVYYYYQIKNLRYLDSGSAQSQITINDLKNVKIPIPSKDIQDKIVEVLNKLDQMIELNNEINNNLQKLINNIFISKFVNYYGYTGEYETTEIGDIPSNWKVDNLGNVISFSNGYGWNSKDMLENNQPDTYKVFKMGNIKIGGGINKEKTRSWILKEKCSELEQFLSKKGDILMCMTDMKSSENPLLGHTALIDCDDEFVINQRVGIIRCDKDIRWPYIYTMTNLPFFINNIRSKAHSGVQVNLTTSGICDTKVLIPDKDSLEEFYKNVTPMYEEMFILNNEIEKLEELRDTLLPKLMNGEIDLDNIEI
jgi:putative uncharacterized protein (fragment)